MKPGTPVVFHEGNGMSDPATTIAVVGTGPSWFKIIDLTITDTANAERDVSHVNDATPGAPYWTLPGEVAVPVEAEVGVPLAPVVAIDESVLEHPNDGDAHDDGPSPER